jgi:hypothetical protein
MEHKQVSGRGAEDEQIAVAELGVLHGLLNGHRLEGDGFAALDDVRLDDRGFGGE